LRKGEKPKLQIDSQNNEDICEEVWSHFRDLSSIKSLGESTGLDIEVINQRWDSKPRQEYVQSVIESLQAKSEKKVVLLDPDTGIEPKVAKREHVKETEVRRFWKSLGQCDWLVLYQHRNRKPDWQELAKSKFQRACDGVDIETFKADELTKDVIFFAAEKR
jgi:CelD/BcsL family acetyltransferase involved in cellulose biosynthesis